MENGSRAYLEVSRADMSKNFPPLSKDLRMLAYGEDILTFDDVRCGDPVVKEKSL